MSSRVNGGGSGIRTHDTVARIAVFKTAAIVHSAIPPSLIPVSNIPYSCPPLRPSIVDLPTFLQHWNEDR